MAEKRKPGKAVTKAPPKPAAPPEPTATPGRVSKKDQILTLYQAGVTEVKAGCRLLRHNAASTLLRAAVPLPTIPAEPPSREGAG